MINDTLIICDQGKFVRDVMAGETVTPMLVANPWNAKHWNLLRDAIEYRDKWIPAGQIKIFRATALWEVGKREAMEAK